MKILTSCHLNMPVLVSGNTCADRWPKPRPLGSKKIEKDPSVIAVTEP